MRIIELLVRMLVGDGADFDEEVLKAVDETSKEDSDMETRR